MAPGRFQGSWDAQGVSGSELGVRGELEIHVLLYVRHVRQSTNKNGETY